MNIPKHQSERELSDKEIAARRDEAVRRALGTPPKPHSEMKIGKKKRKPNASASKS
jgi:hypothetical protein